MEDSNNVSHVEAQSAMKTVIGQKEEQYKIICSEHKQTGRKNTYLIQNKNKSE